MPLIVASRRMKVLFDTQLSFWLGSRFYKTSSPFGRACFRILIRHSCLIKLLFFRVRGKEFPLIRALKVDFLFTELYPFRLFPYDFQVFMHSIPLLDHLIQDSFPLVNPRVIIHSWNTKKRRCVTYDVPEDNHHTRGSFMLGRECLSERSLIMVFFLDHTCLIEPLNLSRGVHSINCCRSEWTW